MSASCRKKRKKGGGQISIALVHTEGGQIKRKDEVSVNPKEISDYEQLPKANDCSASCGFHTAIAALREALAVWCLTAEEKQS